MEHPVETNIRQIVDYAAECGITSADIDQDAALLRQRLEALLGAGCLNEETVYAVCAGVWALQGFLLSDASEHDDDAQAHVAAAANLTIIWMNQILQGARARAICAELMGGAA